MKQLVLTLFFLLCFTSTLTAQDVIYLVNGSRVDNAKITDLSEERITFVVQKTNKPYNFSYLRQNVLVAFRKGNFLIINKLSPDLAQAKKEFQTFLTKDAWQDTDYLLKAVPFGVTAAKISYENDAIVNYVTSDGKSASIPKSELLAIFYRDGRHHLIREPMEVAPLLADLPKPFGTLSQQTTILGKAPIPSAPVSTPVVQPTPEQTKELGLPLSGTPSAVPISKLVLSDEEYQYYRKKALDKVDEFASYLNVITNKTLSSHDRDQAIEQAASLFMPAATIEVTSSQRPGSRRYPIRTYLNNLKLLPYSSTHIEWTEVQYVKELSEAADGNYYGLITAQQTFIGQGSNTHYSDVTQKNVRVKLARYHLTKDGQDAVKWNLLLGSIGVSNQ